MEESLKSKSLTGIAWSFLESASMKIIQFVMSIIMARLLTPMDYGVIAIILIFITISQIFIDGGFATALIQDKKKSDRDYSTIYTFNIALSLFFYIILFFAAPTISQFYSSDITLYMRIQSLSIVIYALSAIHKVKLTIDVNFRAIAKVSVISATISGCMGIVLAYFGFGVWALIGQYLSSAMLTTLLYIILLKWKPICFFNYSSFKRLFPFGLRLMVANLIDRIYMNLYPIFVGKFYTTTELGYYARAEQFSALPANTCSDIFTRVSFPILSKVNDNESLSRYYRKFIVLSSFLIFPILFSVIVLAKPLILILLTDKWETIIVFVQILCFGFVFDHICAINRNLLYVKGKADLALRLEIVKKTIATAILMISIPFGLIGLCVGKAFYGILAFFLNSYYTKQLINVSIYEQIRDFLPSLIICGISSVIVYYVISFFHNMWFQLVGGGIFFVVCYFVLAIITRITASKYIFNLIKESFFNVTTS